MTDMVNSPSHYNSYSVETIDMMEKIWGVEHLIIFCEINAFKYRMRIGLKNEDEAEQDFRKEQWYIRKANELRLKYQRSLGLNAEYNGQN